MIARPEIKAMNIRVLKIAVFAALVINLSGCKDVSNTWAKLLSNSVEPLVANDLNLEQSINGQFFQSGLLAKSTPEMLVAPPPLSSALVPPPPPPVPAPIPVDGLEDFQEYDGPIYTLCGNGVLDRVVNRIACPAFNPTPVFDAPVLIPPFIIGNGTCVGFVYIEQCDDGNTIDNDGCSSVCLKECCGNGIVEEGEECDLGQNRGPALPNISPPANFPIQGSLANNANALFTRPFAACSRPELVTDSQNCSRNCQFIICGDGIVNGNEQCDDGNNLTCDGCYKCTLEKPGACPCNCCPYSVCSNKCCKVNETCDTNRACACLPASRKCNNVCCNLNETCVSNTCTCTNVVCNGVCCAPGQICRGDACI